MSRLGIGYEIGRFTGVCAATGKMLAPGSHCVATLTEPDPDIEVGRDGFVRHDYSVDAWEAGHRPGRLFSFWRTVVPHPDAPRRLLVDDAVLLDLLSRMEGDPRPARQAFRFVLALILLRRRLLRQVGRTQMSIDAAATPPSAEGDDVAVNASNENGDAEDRAGEAVVREVWLLLPRGAAEGERPLRVVDPGLGPEDVASVAEQLGEVLSGEM